MSSSRHVGNDGHFVPIQYTNFSSESSSFFFLLGLIGHMIEVTGE